MMREFRIVALMVAICAVLSFLAFHGLAQGTRTTRGALARLGAAEGEHLDAIAAAIDAATSQPWERALLVSVGWHESRFASDVASCETLGDNGAAVGIWQSHALKCPATLDEQAKEAIRHLRSCVAMCKGETTDDQVLRAVSLYATGRHCNWTGARKRLATFRRIRGDL